MRGSSTIPVIIRAIGLLCVAAAAGCAEAGDSDALSDPLPDTINEWEMVETADMPIDTPWDIPLDSPADMPMDTPVEPNTDLWGDLPLEFAYDTEPDTVIDPGTDTPLDTLPDTEPDLGFDPEWEDISFDLEWEDIEIDFGLDTGDDTTEGIIWCVPDTPTNCALYYYGCCPADRSMVHCYAGFDMDYSCIYPIMMCGLDPTGYMQCIMP